MTPVTDTPETTSESGGINSNASIDYGEQPHTVKRTAAEAFPEPIPPPDSDTAISPNKVAVITYSSYSHLFVTL